MNLADAPTTSLATIASIYKTDKAEHPHYLRSYELFFEPLRRREVRLLELGIKDGGSLMLWRDYFAHGTIAGLDVNPAVIDDASGRIRTYQGMQQDTALLDRIRHEVAPDGFDIIIDDCAHIGALARASFWHLFENHLKAGGIYVIEDWGTGYWDDWLDGVAYRRPDKQIGPLYKMTRAISRIQGTQLGRLPIARRALSLAKRRVVGAQYRSHDFGMVGFVKELVDELGMGDITRESFASAPVRESRFAEMRITPSHLFIVKKG